jgi:hypothetical protein
MVEVVIVDMDERIVHAVGVDDQPVLPRKLVEQNGILHALAAVQLRLVDVDDAIETADVHGELEFRHVPDRITIDEDRVAVLRRDAHVVGDGVRASGIAPMLHHKQDLQRPAPDAICGAARSASSPSRRA